MELIERDSSLSLMEKKFREVSDGEGHCILVSGESGIGKTSLVNAFRKKLKQDSPVFQGTCDAMLTPRPLAPIYDIAFQISDDTWDMVDRSTLFNRIFHALEDQEQATLVIIEDVHWADEATLDFMKFFIRRITRLRCLLILTYSDNEIHFNHPLRSVLGQLPRDFFTRLPLDPLSRAAVEKMAEEKGYKGEDVYSISGGNPFYVTEILANYSTGIPENIKDSILSVYDRQSEKTRQVWLILSVIPSGLEIKYLEKIEPFYAAAIHDCLDTKLLIMNGDLLCFKHELYRRTIESSMSPIVRKDINKRIIDSLLESFERNRQTHRIIHHAKNANEYEVVVKYAPLAARQAASVGAHIEASKLYLTAIEYYQAKDKDSLVQLYELYAYECYLVGQTAEAINYTQRALKHWKEKKDIENIANSTRFLSRLWRFDGDVAKSEAYGRQAIELLEDQPASRAKAMAFSNMSQLKMLSDQPAECLAWGNKAIAMALDLDDDEILCHALTNVGTMQSLNPSSRQRGIGLLQNSLEIALKNSYEEHVARAYTNLVSTAIPMKDYEVAAEKLKEGIRYCEDKDLDSWTAFLLSGKARLKLENGNLNEAWHIVESLLKNEGLTRFAKVNALLVSSKIKMRRGADIDVLPQLLEAKTMALGARESLSIIPAFAAMLEYEWITATRCIDDSELDTVIRMIGNSGNIYDNGEFAFWFSKARNEKISLPEHFEGYKLNNQKEVAGAAVIWRQLCCPYEQALALFEGDDNQKRTAIAIVQKLGADAIYEKMKGEMRASGIKNIPRGIRSSTRSNPANLTDRELEVLQLLKHGLQSKEIAARLFISPKTVDHHISAIFSKLEVGSRAKAVQEAIHLEIIK